MTLSVLLIIYLVFMGLGLLYVLVNFYHILRHGHLDAKSYFVTGIFGAGLVLILFVSATFAITVDWSTPLSLFNSGSGNLTSPVNTQF